MLACLGTTVAAEVSNEDFYHRLQEFDRYYQAFINTLCDWPAQEKCRPDLGHIDYSLFRKAGEAAKKLWI